MASTVQNNQKPSNGATNGDRRSEFFVYLYNIVEDEWNFINALSTEEKRQHELVNSVNTADAFFLASTSEDTTVYVSPIPISKAFRDYAQAVTGGHVTEVVVPEFKSGKICLDLMADRNLFKSLVDRARHYKRLVLTGYAATEEFYALKEGLIKEGLNVYTPEAPDIDSAWTVNFFGSKSGIRQLAQQSTAVEPDLVMPEGVISVGVFDASKIAANKYLKERGVVIKTNKGSGGSGVLIFRDGDLPATYTECEKTISQILSREPYWQKYPIVIESLVKINPAVGGGFPNVEFKILKNGHIDMLYYCKCMVTPQGAFYGVDINEDVISERYAARIVDTGFYVAEKYASAGYRGHFDVDMIAAKNNIFVCESNTRNTGGTDIFKLALRLIGKDFMEDAYIISRSHLPLHSQTPPLLADVLEALSPLLFSHRKKEGVVVNSENKLKEKELIYSIFAADKKRAYKLEDQMKQLLNKLT